MLSTYADTGGAAKAAWRHHHALRSIGIDSTMVTLDSGTDHTPADAVDSVSRANPDDQELAQLRALVNTAAITSNRTRVSRTWFSWPTNGHDVRDHPAIRSADALSIHWVSGLLSMGQLESLFTLGIPVLFTHHDEWLLTGGCHYTAGCGGFRTDCTRCPQLLHDPVGVPAQVLERRIRLGTNTRGTVVSPSRWLRDQSEQSRVFAGWDHEVIPYACDLDTFSPRDAARIRTEHGLSDDRTWLMFIADNLGDERKGFWVLRDALRESKTGAQRLGLVMVGAGEFDAGIPGLEVRSIGQTDSPEMLADLYSACDALILPSLEDNLPNTMIESLACGTPVIGSDVGGIPDFVIPGQTGHLFGVAQSGELAALLDSIDSESLGALGTACRELAESSFSPSLHAEQWVKAAASTPVSEDFEPLPDEPLIHAACSLALQRTAQPNATHPSDDSSEARIASFQRQSEEIAIKLRDSERDRADRLSHIHELNEIIARLTARDSSLIQSIEGTAPRLENAISEIQRTLSQQRTTADDRSTSLLNSIIDSTNSNAASLLSAQQELNARLAEQGETITRLEASRRETVQQAQEARETAEALRADLQASLAESESLKKELAASRSENLQLRIDLEKTLRARVKHKVAQLLGLRPHTIAQQQKT